MVAAIHTHTERERDISTYTMPAFINDTTVVAPEEPACADILFNQAGHVLVTLSNTSATTFPAPNSHAHCFLHTRTTHRRLGSTLSLPSSQCSLSLCCSGAPTQLFALYSHWMLKRQKTTSRLSDPRGACASQVPNNAASD